jgi:precorrin-3B methylase
MSNYLSDDCSGGSGCEEGKAELILIHEAVASAEKETASADKLSNVLKVNLDEQECYERQERQEVGRKERAVEAHTEKKRVQKVSSAY